MINYFKTKLMRIFNYSTAQFSLWLCFGRFNEKKKREIITQTELHSTPIWRGNGWWYFRVSETKRAKERLKYFDACIKQNNKKL
jgi:hypothetical protein